MSVIDKDLIKAINSGTCFSLIGAGPSIEEGYPSWNKLAFDCLSNIDDIKITNKKKIFELIDKGRLLDAFQIMSEAIGKELLVQIIENIFNGITPSEGVVYKLIANWPFLSYLTTNYDDRLYNYLSNNKVSIVVKGNDIESFLLLRSDTKDVIFKIHGGFTDYKNMILTRDDYFKIINDNNYKYWREKISSLLHMSSLVIIGYSANDPNFHAQLERAKEFADPNHPVFMFACDLSPDEIIKLSKEFNIRVIPYTNADGTHRNLKKALRRYDHFICKRKSQYIGHYSIDDGNAEIASSLYLFDALRLSDDNTVIESVYRNVVLQLLIDEKNFVNIIKIPELMQRRNIKSDSTQLHDTLNFMQSEGYIELSPDATSVKATFKAIELFKVAKEKNGLIKDKFISSCNLLLSNSGLIQIERSRVIDKFHAGVIAAFAKRGIEISQMIFNNRELELFSANDILNIINYYSDGLNEKEKIGFLDLMLEVLQNPDKEVRDYLGILCNGYFSFHALGYDKKSSQERIDIIKKRKWLIDSSILIPLIAMESINYDYACDLIIKANNLGIKLYTTTKLLYELKNHAYWASSRYSKKKIFDVDFFQAATSGYGYKQNLFVDGCVKWSLSESNPTFNNYMKKCLGDNYESQLEELLIEKLKSLNINIYDVENVSVFDTNCYGDIEEICNKIKELRCSQGTYKNDNQCLAEAEVYEINKLESCHFLTHSPILKKIIDDNQMLHWTPETLYRMLSLFSPLPLSAENLYSCMIEDFFNSGFNVINKEIIESFLSPIIKQSKMDLEEEKKNHQVNLEKYIIEITPEKHRDIDIPFYTYQTALYIARKEKELSEGYKKTVEELKKVKSLSIKERTEFERLKNRKKSKEKKRKNKTNNKK